MKRYVVILLFNIDMSKVLLIKRKRNPYLNLYNGIGGKIEDGESKFDCCIRETKEEINVNLCCPKQLVTCVYPENDKFKYNSNVELNVFYDVIKENVFEENDEGTFEWLKVDFVLNANNKLIAGYGNVGIFMREILHIENKYDFYN